MIHREAPVCPVERLDAIVGDAGTRLGVERLLGDLSGLCVETR